MSKRESSSGHHGPSKVREMPGLTGSKLTVAVVAVGWSGTRLMCACLVSSALLSAAKVQQSRGFRCGEVRSLRSSQGQKEGRSELVFGFLIHGPLMCVSN